MNSISKQLSIALQVYLARGHLLITHLRSGNWPEAAAAWRARKAAFLNYRVADSLAADAAAFYRSQAAQELLQGLLAQEQILLPLVAKRCEEARQMLKRLKQQRQQLLKYRSRHGACSTFARSI